MNDKVSVMCSPKALTKMLAYTMICPVEVAWHGITRRIESGKYVIEDVMLFPQTVSGARVSTDFQEYANWSLEMIKNGNHNNIRFHGHSHVNMGVFSSGIDDDWQEIVDDLREDDYYVFIIMNKRLDILIRIYDMKDGAMYDSNHDMIYFDTPEHDLHTVFREMKKYVQPYTSRIATCVDNIVEDGEKN